MPMVSSTAQSTTAPPAWFFNLGLDDPAKAGGKWLRRIRESLSGPNGTLVSQRLMADYLGVHPISVCRYENGDVGMPYEVVMKLLVQEMRLIGLGKLTIEKSLIGQLFTSKAIPSGIRESTFNSLINGLTAMRDRFIEESWAKSTSSV